MPTSDTLILTDAAIADLTGELCRRAGQIAGRRLLVGIAGIPGSGKSTLAHRLCEAINAQMPGLAALVPMDGFHWSNTELRARGLMERKGSPETFDAAGYVAMLERCRDGGFVGRVRVYDRAVHEPVFRDEPQSVVSERTRLILTEGNYLLLERGPWSRLAAVLDEAWLLETPMEQARAWLLARHQQVGRTLSEAERRCDADAQNMQLVLAASRAPGRRLRWGEGREVSSSGF